MTATTRYMAKTETISSTGWMAIDRMFGGAGNDVLEGGGTGNDYLSGGAGNDELVGYDGADTLEGGSGTDRFKLFLGSFNPSSTLAITDIVLDFEGAGATGGDQIDLSGSGFLSFRGTLSVDPVEGTALYTHPSNPVIRAQQSGAGNGLTDIFYTVRDGNTWLLVDENDNGTLDAIDSIIRFNGVHAFTEADFTARTNFVVAGTNKSDNIDGTEDNDILFGLVKNDSLFGMGGDDDIYGGLGNDYLDGGAGSNNLFGDAGTDTLTLANSNGGSAYGGDGNDLLIGGDVEFSFSWLEGGTGNDRLVAGAAGATMVDFDGGNDVLVGGAGDDSFTGGAGTDLFVFGKTWTSPSGFQDIIWDFEDGKERIDLRTSGLKLADLNIESDGFSAILLRVPAALKSTVRPTISPRRILFSEDRGVRKSAGKRPRTLHCNWKLIEGDVQMFSLFFQLNRDQ
jgi:Ca2+-binding RTX toxin-like protein